MKVVLDTNIWVSAIIWGGIPDEIIILQQRNLLTIGMSEKLLNELERTFNKKKIQPKLEVLNLTSSSAISLVKESVVLYPIEELFVPELRDPDDNIVLATAIAAKANVIITGDQDLLVLEEYQEIKIMTAKDFLQQHFGNEGN
ncbi:MAG: putative toxin-antitoxin system toxin component, PIN family [Pseudanabaena frigida]|uniref:Putative toxin-antitoxin system toxin component, PIN family n=1 Tax=Pseudanabaena frigida TaxID=945775 RepID=A0A2W4WC40_9CYAN|nr:MAG: putative toxin-antitoxin system toxin component, PIN family [Pseudanabaena frigida]